MHFHMHFLLYSEFSEEIDKAVWDKRSRLLRKDGVYLGLKVKVDYR